MTTRITYWLTFLSLACTALLTLSTVAHAEPNFQAGGARRVASDGNGNVKSAGARGFRTESGAYGRQSGSFTRNEDGSASGQRSTKAYNPNTGNTFEGSTTYTKGEGVSRSASCKDSSGNTVTCGDR